MKDIIRLWNIKKIYHFTDASNLESIMKYGLLSLEEIEQRGIAAQHGGNKLSRDEDKRKGLHKYIHLSFTDNHPMLYIKLQAGEIKEPRILFISSAVMLEPGVLFTNDVSNKSGITSFDSTSFNANIDCEVLFTHTDWLEKSIQQRRQKAEKSEILVPNHIPVDKILNI